MDEAEALVDDASENVSNFIYRYDYGDRWDHKIVFEKEDPGYNVRHAEILKYKGDNFEEDTGGVCNNCHTPFDIHTADSRLAQYEFPDVSAFSDHELGEKLRVQSYYQIENAWLRFCVQWNDKKVTEAQLYHGRSRNPLREILRGKDIDYPAKWIGLSVDGCSEQNTREAYAQYILQHPEALNDFFDDDDLHDLMQIASAEYDRPLKKADYFECIRKGLRTCILEVRYSAAGTVRKAEICFASDLIEKWKRINPK